MLDVREEALASLLAVVPNVDSGLELARDDVPGRVPDGGGERRGVDVVPAALSDEHLGEHPRPRQAAGVRREDASLASLHAIA